MRTPILIVRLIGIYLLMSNAATLYQVARMPVSNMPGTEAYATKILEMQVIAASLAFVGLLMTRYAAWVVKVLTFDAREGNASQDLGSRILDADAQNSDK